jgi:hypothetical protein
MGWSVVAASVVGTSHEASGAPCQDRHRSLVTDTGELLIAVADGTGSAERGAEGAQRAVDAAIDRLDSHSRGGGGQLRDWEAAVADAFRWAKQSISDLGSDQEGGSAAFATTLTCAVATAERLIVGQVGDVIVVVEDDRGELILAVAPQRGEYANEVVVLTMEGALDHLEIASLPASARFAVLSDGLLRLAINLASGEPHAPFFRPLFAFAAETAAATADEREAELAGFLRSERVCARSDDDKTLVLAVRAADSYQAVDDEAVPTSR